MWLRKFQLFDFAVSYYVTDQDVMDDHEIQGLANEMSSQGLGSGGTGEVVVIWLPDY